MTNAARVGKMRVLVVEDDPDACEIYEGTLRHAGYEVTVVTTLADARRAVEACPPNVVILDGRLPDGRGTELLFRWKRSSTMSKVPVMLITAFSDASDVHAAALAGADGFVVKPCSADALLACLSRALTTNAPTRQIPRTRTSEPRLALVQPTREDRAKAKFHELNGTDLQTRCGRCTRVSPPLGPSVARAEARVTSLGWAHNGESWTCPVCIERRVTSPPRRE